MRAKPRLFIGSSGEALDTVRDIEVELSEVFDIKRWDKDIFQLGEAALESLVSAAENCDGAILLMTFDDHTRLRGKLHRASRDNVVFELGLFMGALGRSQCVILADSSIPKAQLPSDLLGVTTLRFDGSASADPASLRSACTRIRKHFQEHPRSTRGKKLCDKVRPSLELATRAASLPMGPDDLDIRVFLFRVEDSELVCRACWSQTPTEEHVDILKFSEKEHRDLSVVKAWRERKPQGHKVDRRKQMALASSSPVEGDLQFVLAAPILMGTEVWGVVDFDTSTDGGAELLSGKKALAVVVQLASQMGALVTARD